tara:strand:- start:1432 stop:2523 length:1092 start_codon:yes stop_codon:yes gene_type:complete
MSKFSKGSSREEDYKRKLLELENFIAKNRLVSKEAQMSSMSGEGYTDPRFFKTTGNPLIDQYGMRPFPAEGSGQILSTTELGMGGKKELFNIGNPGKYRPIADTIVYKDISDLYKNTDLTPVTTETTQKHEFFHRAAKKSGWINNFHNSPYLKKKAKLLAGERGRKLRPLINEAVAHSYEYDANDYSKNKELKGEIRFRASKFNLKNPEKIADEIFNDIKYLRDDFEKYLEEVTVEYLPENVNSYTTTRTNKANGGEIQSALDEFGIKPIGETSSFKMAMAVLSPEQKLKKIKLLKKYFDRMNRAESLQKPGAALGDLSEAAKIKKGIPYSSTKSIQKELDQLQGTEKLDLNLLARLRKELNI